MDISKTPAFEIVQGPRKFYQTKLPAQVLASISYASVRGKDNEPGAIQRVLNPRRISSIKDFYISGGDIPANIILNFVSTDQTIKYCDGQIAFFIKERLAQIIDGQHRVAGLRAAILEMATIADLEIPVAIYQGLTTQECANIFLAINTEQKPVPRSLVFDLYEIASSELVDEAAVRARDIVAAMNDERTSPYHEQFKFPGDPRRKGGIALSTAVTEIKPLVEPKGDFERIGFTSLEMQKQALLNFWETLRKKYGDNWDTTKNAFLYASGFSGGIEFFRLRLIPYCNQKRSFQKDIMEKSIIMDDADLIFQEEVRGLGGKDAPRKIYYRLDACFRPIGEDGSGFLV